MTSTLNATLLNETEVSYVSYHHRPETYIVPILFFIIFVVGTLGNGTLIRIFVKHKNMRNVPNTYLFSLALGDLLVIWTNVPFTSTVYTVESWPYGVLICKISESAKDISIGVSVFTLTALSADRFFAIVDPLSKFHSGGCAKREISYTVITIAFIWILSSILALPAAIFSFLKSLEINEHKKIEVCYPFPEDKHPWYARTVVMFKFVVYYALPLVIIGFFYILMARHLVLSTKNLPGESSRQVRARKKVAKMVSAFVFIFAICFLPQHVFMLWFYNNPNADTDYNAFWHALRIVAFSLSYAISCINPIALFCVSATFRKYFNRYLFCCCKRKISRTDSMSMMSIKRVSTFSRKRNGESSALSSNYNNFRDRQTLTTRCDGDDFYQ
ncbi:UNVERIFIED_CONTAM: hypothetical protein PYX00_002987 [Menopon gallinae]|uniref:G-protein coupled receptors family 1 profile domain-containing protein n=1 Tax=Menopon gallinae TaxID=328185 RepID=A0AAW2HYW6_9NEOP